jgi:hypothetical protein
MSARSQLHELLVALGKRSAYFSYATIKLAVREAELDLKDSSLKSYLTKAVDQKIIHDAGRGWYSTLSEPIVLDSKPLRPLIKAIEKAFPLLDFTVWSTAQLNPWMHHLIAKPVAFVNVQPEAVNAVAEKLEELGWKVLADPDAEEGTRRLQPGERMVVVRRARQRAPEPVGHQARLEQVLVDVQVEVGLLPIMDPHEARQMVRQALGSGLLQVSELQRYANSRNVTLDEMSLIN